MLRIGTVYRYSNVIDPTTPIVDGLPNYFYETYVQNFSSFKFQRGIHIVQAVTGPDGRSRIPVIIISSSPHKAGSVDTPWQDEYNPDHGYVKYYGDNKSAYMEPNNRKLGNRKLLEFLPVYKSNLESDRENNAVPIVFFERTTINGRLKGNLKFQGFGVLDTAELVTQYDVKNGIYFPNYRFYFCVFSLKEDQEAFDWSWIAKRCDPSLSTPETTKFAPNIWKRWVKKGDQDLHLA